MCYFDVIHRGAAELCNIYRASFMRHCSKVIYSDDHCCFIRMSPKAGDHGFRAVIFVEEHDGGAS